MQTEHSSVNDLPALLGGSPVRPEGPPDWPPDAPEIAEALQRAIQERTWGKYHGPHCEELTEQLTLLHECEHAMLCSSGTAAVELALRGLKVGEGDEVVLAGYDFKGNFQNVLKVGALPVLVDLRADNWNLDTARLAESVTPATKAILVSHLHGGMVSMPEVMQIAEPHGIPVIEDACQMPGAVLEGKKAGTWGDIGVLSFGGSKLLSAGRGGALWTRKAEIAQRIRLYTQRGNEAYPLSELQAAVLLPQLQKLEETNRQRSQNVDYLDSLLEDLGIVPFTNDALDCKPGYYKVGFQYRPEVFSDLPREIFARAVRAEGIALDPGFRALHKTHSRRRYRASGELLQATEADRRVLTLHHPILLETKEDIAQIPAALDKIRQHATMIRESLQHTPQAKEPKGST